MLPLLWSVALPGEQDRALHALGAPETAASTAQPTEPRQAANATLPKLSKEVCLDQLKALPHALVVPEAGLMWCPNAKAGTSTMTKILQRKLDPRADLINEMASPAGLEETSPRGRLSESAQEKCVDAGTLSWEAKQAFCERGDALSFTILRNPWERTVSAYLSKVARGEISPDGDASHTLSFSQFVQWLSSNNDSDDFNIHFLSWCAFA